MVFNQNINDLNENKSSKNEEEIRKIKIQQSR